MVQYETNHIEGQRLKMKPTIPALFGLVGKIVRFLLLLQAWKCKPTFQGGGSLPKGLCTARFVSARALLIPFIPRSLRLVLLAGVVFSCSTNFASEILGIRDGGSFFFVWVGGWGGGGTFDPDTEGLPSWRERTR